MFLGSLILSLPTCQTIPFTKFVLLFFFRFDCNSESKLSVSGASWLKFPHCLWIKAQQAESRPMLRPEPSKTNPNRRGEPDQCSAATFMISLHGESPGWLHGRIILTIYRLFLSHSAGWCRLAAGRSCFWGEVGCCRAPIAIRERAASSKSMADIHSWSQSSHVPWCKP